MPVLQNVPSGQEVTWHWGSYDEATYQVDLNPTINWNEWFQDTTARMLIGLGSPWADPEGRERVPINQRAELRDRLGIAYDLYFYP